MQKKITLHKVKLETLLWVLGGFEITSKDKKFYTFYTENEMELLREYYTTFKSGSRISRGRLTELGERLNRRPKSISRLLSKWRAEGKIDW